MNDPLVFALGARRHDGGSKMHQSRIVFSPFFKASVTINLKQQANESLKQYYEMPKM